MISNGYSLVGGYSCAVIAIIGVVFNVTTLVVLGSHRKLRQQPTTVIILAITIVDAIKTGVILPLHASDLIHCWFKSNILD